MLFGRDLFGRDPFGRSAFGDEFSTDAPFGDVLNNVESDLVFVADLYPYDPDAAMVVNRAYTDFERPVHFPDTDQKFLNLIIKALSSRNDAFVLAGGQVSAGGTSGEVVLALADGNHDELVGFHFDGRDIDILLGTMDLKYFQFQPVFKGKGLGVGYTTDQLKIGIRDTTELLLAPLQSSMYVGDESTVPQTLEGEDSLGGRHKPLAFGECKNVPLLLINRGFLVYQFHDGPCKAVDGVYDKGVALTPQPDGVGPVDTNYPVGSIQRLGFADVFAWVGGGTPSDPPLTAGNYIYDLSKGIIRTNGLPKTGHTGLLTADVRGDTGDTDLGGPGYLPATNGYVTKIGELIQRVISREGVLHKFGDVVLDELDQLSVDQPGELQFFADGRSEISILAVIDVWLTSIGGYRETTRTGLLTAGLVKFNTPVKVLEEQVDVLDLRAVTTSIPVEFPVHTLTFGYDQSYIVQENEPEDVLPGASTARKEFVSVPYRLYTAPNSGGVPDQAAIDVTKTRRLLSEELVVNSKFVNSADAMVEADRRHALLEPDYMSYKLTTRDQRFLRRLGETVTLKHSRFGLSAGKDFIIFGIEEDTNTLQTVLMVWGGKV